ncbi:hypothetical protein ACFU8Q_06795 [Streptomyces sp. NPDC057543]|uniref:hypothetical protein n=1 Tax=Streptomyces sp. NPDC057543 TaxID=3346163 RepID=UPI0036A051C2
MQFDIGGLPGRSTNEPGLCSLFGDDHDDLHGPLVKTRLLAAMLLTLVAALNHLQVVSGRAAPRDARAR